MILLDLPYSPTTMKITPVTASLAFLLFSLIFHHMSFVYKLTMEDAAPKCAQPKCNLQPCARTKFTQHFRQGVANETVAWKRKKVVEESRTSDKRGLVLGLATQNIALNRLAVFIRSVRNVVSRNTDIVILADYLSNGTRAQLFEEFDVIEKVLTVPTNVKGYHPNSGRWVLLRNFLFDEDPNKYSSVLFTDVRDVMFQADPFERMEGDEDSLFVFREASPARLLLDGTIATEQRNKGVTMGGWEASLVYAQLMMDTILSKEACIDQGVHNYLAYSGQLAEAIAPKKLRVVPLEGGWVASIQSMPRWTIKRTKAGTLMNAEGMPFALVHQYDRSHDRLDRQYMDSFGTVQDGVTVHAVP